MTLYMKRGKKYVPAKEFTGFPVEGIWWVERKPGKNENRWIAKLSDLPVQSNLAKLEAYRDEACAALHNVRVLRPSTNDMVTAVFTAIAKKMTEEIFVADTCVCRSCGITHANGRSCTGSKW